MTYKEAANRIEDHMNIHKLNEPRAIHISEALKMAVKILNMVASGELVPVVHCKECRWGRSLGLGCDLRTCYLDEKDHRATDFCNYGERKDDKT